jgi:hypothetical protein
MAGAFLLGSLSNFLGSVSHARPASLRMRVGSPAALSTLGPAVSSGGALSFGPGFTAEAYFLEVAALERRVLHSHYKEACYRCLARDHAPEFHFLDRTACYRGGRSP